MTETFNALLNIIVDDCVSRGYRPLPPASVEEIDRVRTRVPREFQCQLPGEYYELIGRMDGAYISELMIAGTRARSLIYASGAEHPNVQTLGIVDSIKEAHIDYGFPSHVLTTMVGEFRYSWDAQQSCWLMADLGFSVYKQYRNFEEMLADALSRVGRDTRHLMPEDFEYFAIDDSGQPLRGIRRIQQGSY